MYNILYTFLHKYILEITIQSTNIIIPITDFKNPITGFFKTIFFLYTHDSFLKFLLPDYSLKHI